MAMNVTQEMELTQALQTLKWMDEERRRDKAVIAALEERIQLQDHGLAQQATQIQELRTALAGVQGVLSRVTEFEQMVAKLEQAQEENKQLRQELTRLTAQQAMTKSRRQGMRQEMLDKTPKQRKKSVDSRLDEIADLMEAGCIIGK